MDLKSQIESLLFISAKPVALSQLVEAMEKSEDEIKDALKQLADEYKENGRGIEIIRNGQKYQMVSHPDNAQLVQKFISDETSGELSRPSLETLTIIAYRGPISKLELERIRGVNCSLILRNLLMRGLIESKQDKDKNESAYSVTLDFVRFLGIGDVEELPDYAKLNSNDLLEQVLSQKEEQPA